MGNMGSMHEAHEGDGALRTAAVITVSDRSAAGERRDAAGPALCDLLAKEGYEVVATEVVPDEQALIEGALRRAAALDVALCVTTGGTGLSPRDVTPEATMAVCDRLVPGIGEAMRAASARITPHAWLSRATAGTCARTLVVNVPGSPKGAVENLSAVIAPIAHGLRILRGGRADCAGTSTPASDASAAIHAGASAPGVPDDAAPACDLTAKRCILFDFDGTLADTKPTIVKIARRVLREWGMTDEQVGDAGRLVGPPFPGAFTEVYGMSPEDALEVTRRYRAIYADLGPETHPLFDGMAELLFDLKAAGRRLAITSSKMQGTVTDCLKDTGIYDAFEVIVGQVDPTRADKTHLVEDSLSALGCGADDAVMVGDRFYDVAGARANDVACVGVYLGGTARSGELEEAGATVCVHSVARLRRILLG